MTRSWFLDSSTIFLYILPFSRVGSRWVSIFLSPLFIRSPGHVQVLDSPGFEEDKNLIRQVFRTHEVWDAAGMDCGFMLGLLLGSRSDMLEVWDVNRYDIYVRWKIMIVFDVALIGFNLDIWWTSSALKCTQRPHAIWCLRAQLRLDTPGPRLIIALDLACQALSLHKLSDEAQQRCDAYRFGFLMSRCSVTWRISRNSMWIICELCLEMFGTNGCDGCIHVTWNISQIRLLQEIWPAKHTEIIWDPFLSICRGRAQCGRCPVPALWCLLIVEYHQNIPKLMSCHALCRYQRMVNSREQTLDKDWIQHDTTWLLYVENDHSVNICESSKVWCSVI